MKTAGSARGQWLGRQRACRWSAQSPASTLLAEARCAEYHVFGLFLHGSPYASDVRKLLSKRDIVASMSRKDDYWDSAKLPAVFSQTEIFENHADAPVAA
jgi:hypothetical protein